MASDKIFEVHALFGFGCKLAKADRRLRRPNVKLEYLSILQEY